MRSRGRLRIIIAIATAVAGLVALAYPPSSNLWYDRRTDLTRGTFTSRLAGDARDPLYQHLEAENERLFETGQSDLVDAFSFEVPGIDLTQYGLADDRIGYIDLPTIDMTLPIFLGATKANLRLGAVHLAQTSYPIGGPNTTTVIAAHRGGALKMFRNIHLMRIGDEITITNPFGRLTYRTVEIRIIKPTDIDAIKIQPGRDVVALITCNPLGHSYERYVVFCERVA